jgi:hypothetical protein
LPCDYSSIHREGEVVNHREGEVVKRPFGVVFSAILLILGSLFQLLMALGMAFSGFILQTQIHSGGLPPSTAAPPLPGLMPGYIYAVCIFFVALSVWGIATAVGLIRLLRWARYSVLVIGGILALIGLLAFLFTLLLLLVPLPAPAYIDASHFHTAHVVTKIIFGVLALLHGINCAVGVSWLVYFNRQKVREAFNGESGMALVSRRPVLISVIAVLSMFGAVTNLLMLFLPQPGAFFGWILYGWEKAAYYVVFAALAVSVGIGLWQIKKWGWWLALAKYAFGLIHCFVFLVCPSLLLRYRAVIHQMMNPAQPLLSERYHMLIHNAMFGFCVVFIMAILAILINYRKAFQPPADLSPTESVPPQ